jgi:hypothetical protein
MDDEHTQREVDTRVRGALSADRVASRRLVMRALAQGGEAVSRDTRRRLAAVTAAALALVVGVSTWQWRRTARVEEREPFIPGLARDAGRRGATEPLPASPASRGMNASPSVRSPDPPSLAITGRGSLLVVDSQDGRRWVVGAPPARRAGGNYVIVVPQ